MITWLLDLILPQSCLGCNSRGDILCSLCISKLRPAERETNRGIVACFDYRDPIIKRAIWNLKYYNRRHLGRILGKLLYEARLEDISEMKMFTGESPIYVVPVPISQSRKKKRGYNQAGIIAREFCKHGGKNIFELKEGVLVKKKDTLPQARITNRTVRLRNIRGAFDIKNPEEVIGKTIIVVDDVTTTGATLTEIIKILQKSGAKKVVGFAVAH